MALAERESQRWEEALKVCDKLWDRFGSHTSSDLLQTAAKGMTMKIAILGQQGHVSQVFAVGRELLNRLDMQERRARAGEVADYDAGAFLPVRLETHEIRMLAHTKAGNNDALVDETKTILGILPRLPTIPARTIQCIMIAS